MNVLKGFVLKYGGVVVSRMYVMKVVGKYNGVGKWWTCTLKVGSSKLHMIILETFHFWYQRVWRLPKLYSNACHIVLVPCIEMVVLWREMKDVLVEWIKRTKMILILCLDVCVGIIFTLSWLSPTFRWGRSVLSRVWWSVYSGVMV